MSNNLDIRDLYVDIQKDVYTSLYAKEGEVNSRGLRVFLLNNGSIMDTSGMELHLYGRTKGGKVYRHKASPVSGANGVFQLLYPANMLKAGDIEAELRLTNGNYVVASKTFTITVDKAILSEDMIDGSNDPDFLSMLIDILNKIESGELKGEKGDKGDPGGPPGPPGEPGEPGLSAYQIWLNEGNEGTEQDFIESLKGPQGPQGPPGEGADIDQDFIDTVENNKFRINFIWGKSTDWSYLFTNQDLETIDFSNMVLPGFFYRDNWTPGIKYNLSRMFAGATFGTPPPGDPFDWGWDPDIPDSNFWKWFMNLTFIMEIIPSSLEYMFANATGDVIMLPDLSIYNVSASGMFSGAKVNEIDLGWGFGYGINDMSYMFSGVSNPDGGPTEVNLSKLYTTGATNMESMFKGSNISTLDLSSFDTSNVTNMSEMFRDTQAVTLDLSSFDTSNVTNMVRMFTGSQATTLDLSSFDTSNVTDMGGMFSKSQATTLDLSSFDTSNVTNMDGMFWNSQATTGYARTQADADRFNASSSKPSSLNFVVHPDLV